MNYAKRVRKSPHKFDKIHLFDFKRNENLDILRGFCVFLVLATHILGSTDLPGFSAFANDIFHRIWAVGSFGVTGFFVLSSYLLSKIFIEEVQSDQLVVRHYFVRRILRIGPLYFLALIVAYLIELLLNLNFHLIPYFLFVQNFFSYKYQLSSPISHLWSVCVEEQFYLLLPGLFLLGRRIRISIALFLCFISPLCRLITIHLAYPAVWNFSSSHLDAFGYGLLLAQLSSEKRIAWLKGKTTRMLIFPMAITFSALCSSNTTLLYTSNASAWSYSVAALLWTAVIAQSGGLEWNFPFSKKLVFLGVNSYGIYVFHWIALWSFRKTLNISSLPLWLSAIIFVLTIVIAYFSKKYIEAPFMRKAKMYRGKRNT